MPWPRPGRHLSSKVGLLPLAMFRKVWVLGAARWPSDLLRNGEPCQGARNTATEGGGNPEEPSLRSRMGRGAPARLGGSRGFGKGAEVGSGVSPGPVLTLLS